MRKAILLNDINSFAEFVKDGNIAIFPTDTVWGIGVFVEKENKIKDIFVIKNRDTGKKLPLLVGSKDYLYENFYISEKEEKIIENFMPGPLTIILKPKIKFPDLVMQYNTVAIRIPDCKALRDVLSSYPMAATSANISGKDPLATMDDVIKVFGKYSVGIVNFNMCFPEGKSSTIIKFVDDKLHILREGSIKKESIEEVIFNG